MIGVGARSNAFIDDLANLGTEGTEFSTQAFGNDGLNYYQLLLRPLVLMSFIISKTR